MAPLPPESQLAAISSGILDAACSRLSSSCTLSAVAAVVAGDADVELLQDLLGGVRVAGELVDAEEEQVGEQLADLLVDGHVGEGLLDPGELAQSSRL